MNQELVYLIFGSILHDIGKAVQRASGQKIRHPLLGANFLKRYIDEPQILKQLKYHHSRELKEAKLAKNALVYITYIADNIASGLDRRTIEGIEQSTYHEWDTYQNLQDIFNQFKVDSYKDRPKRFYAPRLLDDREDMNRAKQNIERFSQGYYAGIVERLQHGLKRISPTEEYVDSLINLLEATLTYVPSSTNLEEVADVSLFDHMKVTAAIASCIYHYLLDRKIDDYKQVLFKKTVAFYKQEAFRLVAFDISGIQSFIYTIRDQKAQKMLRSRSFYLEMLAENIIDNLLERAELSRANLLYSGGGNAYILMPNVPKAIEAINAIEKETNQFLRETFQNKLYVAFASVPCSSNVLNPPDKEQSDYGQLYRTLSQQLDQKKLHRYSPDEIRELNRQGKVKGKECPVCYRIYQEESMQEDTREFCSICRGLVDFSNQIQRAEFYAISSEESPLPVGFQRYLKAVSSDSIQSEEINGRVYSKNKFYTGKYQSKNLWIGDYTDARTFEDYAKGDGSEGVGRLGVLRCDVDDLGSAFCAGFKNKYNTISRSATFSRSLAMFFQFHMNRLLARDKVKASIIYSGGDDVFIIGAWKDLLNFSVTLRQEFIQYSNHKLTLSAGFGLFANKTPVPILAEQTGRLEAAAKSKKDEHYNLLKDSIALFEDKFVFLWDDFIERVYNGKLVVIEEFFKKSDLSEDYGKAFIYRLLDLIRQRNREINDKRIVPI